MNAKVVFPAQLRGARAMLGWTQGHLAEAADVHVTTVQHSESRRRDGDEQGVQKIVEALCKAGIAFVIGEDDGSLGVQLLPPLPSIVRHPRPVNVEDHVLTCPIEWRAKKYTLAVSLELLDDADGKNYTSAAAYIEAFRRHRSEILQAAQKAIEEGDVLPDRRVYVTNENCDIGTPKARR